MQHNPADWWVCGVWRIGSAFWTDLTVGAAFLTASLWGNLPWSGAKCWQHRERTQACLWWGRLASLEGVKFRALCHRAKSSRHACLNALCLVPCVLLVLLWLYISCFLMKDFDDTAKHLAVLTGVTYPWLGLALSSWRCEHCKLCRRRPDGLVLLLTPPTHFL